MSPDAPGVTRQQVLDYAASLRFATAPGTGDEQKVTPPPSPAPLMRVQPESGTVALDTVKLRRGRIIALITSTGAYPKLGAQPGRNYWWVDRNGDPAVNEGWRSLMIPVNPTFNLDTIPLLYKYHTQKYAQALARLVYRAYDELVWESCTSNGCCCSGTPQAGRNAPECELSEMK